MPRRVEFNGKIHEFPDDASDDEIRQVLSGEPGGNVLDDPNNVYQGKSNGIPVYSHPPGPAKPPLPKGIDQPGTSALDVARNAYGRVPNVINGASAGVGLGKFFGPADPITVPAGAILGGLGGAFLPPSQNPSLDTAAAVAGAGANALLPGAGSTSKLWQFLRGLGTTGATVGAGYLGAMADDAMGGTPIQGAHGKLWLYGITGGLANSLKAFTAPATAATGPIGQAANEVEQQTGVRVPLSLPQKTGNFQSIGNGVSQQGLDLEQSQIQATKDALGKIAGRPLADTGNVVGTANNDLKELIRQRYGSMMDEWKQANATTTTVDQPSKILGSDGLSAFTTSKTTTQLPEDIQWEQFADHFGLEGKDINNLKYIAKRPTSGWLDQFLGGTGEQSSPGLERTQTMMKLLPDDAKGNFATALTLRAIDKAGVVKSTIDGLAMNASGLQKALQNGALSQVLDPDQYKALQKLSGIMQDVGKPMVDASGRTISYLGNKTAFTIAGNVGGAAMGAEMGHGAVQKALGGIAGALGATAVMAKFSTVLSAIMHNPELAGVMEKAARGDASAVNAFTRSLISGADSELNPTQPESRPASYQTRYQGFFKK